MLEFLVIPDSQAGDYIVQFSATFETSSASQDFGQCNVDFLAGGEFGTLTGTSQPMHWSLPATVAPNTVSDAYPSGSFHMHVPSGGDFRLSCSATVGNTQVPSLSAIATRVDTLQAS